MQYDVAIVGGGPSGSACAITCAQAGRPALLLERAVFPREKVCGDCLNPSCWPILERLGVADRVLAQPHSRFSEIVFAGARGASISCALTDSPRGEIAIPRSVLDSILLDRAREAGVDAREGVAVTAIAPGWEIATSAETFHARVLVAADGRNSTVARLLGLLPAAKKDRVGAQTHLPLPAGFGEKVQMHFLPHGYCGTASVGGGLMNLCLVARPARLPSLKLWAAGEFQIPPDQPWRTITPLEREAVHPAHENLLLIGDAARVVEPFTGEGIYYALASGMLAASHIASGDLSAYAPAHARLYRGRLWVNQLAKAAVLHPSLASFALAIARVFPGALQFLTARVVGAAGVQALSAANSEG
jgi:flavin-dependent dehydrogenase